MAYCTLDDLKKNIDEAEIEQLTDDENSGSISTARVNEAIANADSLIDGFCGSRYSVPFSPVPSLIRNISIRLAIYYLYERRGRLSEEQIRNYEAQLKLLRDIASGTISPGIQPQPEASPAGDVAVCSTEISDREFTKQTLACF